MNRSRLVGLALAFTLMPTLLAAQSPSPDPEALETRSESWKCRNDLEVQCGLEGCETEAGDGFTPMSVSADASGALSVCAYSGCWEGAGEVVRSERFLVLIGHDLAFSTSPEASSEDIVIAIDRKDGIATLKAGEFAHALLCETLGHT